MTSKVNRRTLLLGLGAATASAATTGILAQPTEAAPSFQFLFITDSHLKPELNATVGTDAAFKKARNLPVDFAIQGGDHIFDAGAVPKDRAISLFDLYAKTEQDLAIKVHHTLGNHDCLGILETSIPSTDPLYGKRIFEQRFGPTFYTFDHKRCGGGSHPQPGRLDHATTSQGQDLRTNHATLVHHNGDQPGGSGRALERPCPPVVCRRRGSQTSSR